MNRHRTGIVAIALSMLALPALAGEGTARPTGEAEVAAMDANHDGRLSADEHAAGAKTMFARMDADHDGQVTAAEMDAAHKSMPTSGSDAPTRMSAAEKIKVVDSDGILSAQEHEAGSRRMFDKMDEDHDGALSSAEISAGHKAMLKKSH